ncbi:hypothetical protein NW768_007584 [Fusarium equiseti]|uniref:Uncharacterized protein n=1 Tax=Fusarium equiseti TaxID=61235 RepID=A0ABQ8R880_FUSEQ|nr:hypothetical protein NW768_007584 [Fusarium equiseti]
MQASLFKILAITAAFSTVLSAPVDPVEGQVNVTETTELAVEATPVKVAEVKETDAGDVVRAFLHLVPNGHFKVAPNPTLMICYARLYSKSVPGTLPLTSAQERNMERSSSGLVGNIPAMQTGSVSNGDVWSAIFTFARVGSHTRDAISANAMLIEERSRRSEQL